MIIVIQCAASKKTVLTNEDGYYHDHLKQRIIFVSNPKIAPPIEGVRYAHPDDIAESGLSWRKELLNININSNNTFELYQAWDLYKPKTHPYIYKNLKDYIGIDRFYILSAGWGLIPANFWTPSYDITFNQKIKYKTRKSKDHYEDFNMLPETTKEPVIFIGGEAYLYLFCKLTNQLKSDRIVYYNLKHKPIAPGCRLIRYQTNSRTNWHYNLALDIVSNHIDINKCIY